MPFTHTNEHTHIEAGSVTIIVRPVGKIKTSATAQQQGVQADSRTDTKQFEMNWVLCGAGT